MSTKLFRSFYSSILFNRVLFTLLRFSTSHYESQTLFFGFCFGFCFTINFGELIFLGKVFNTFLNPSEQIKFKETSSLQKRLMSTTKLFIIRATILSVDRCQNIFSARSTTSLTNSEKFVSFTVLCHPQLTLKSQPESQPKP